MYKRAKEYYSQHGVSPLILKGLEKSYTRIESLFFTLPVIDNICYRTSRDVLNSRADQEEDLNDIVRTAFEYSGYGVYRTIRPQQIRVELRKLAKRVKQQDPSVIMEIGTAEGGTLYTWSRYLDPDIVISVDLPGGLHGGGYPKEKTKFYRSFSDADYYFLRADSQKRQTKQQVREILSEDEIDFLYIDGDHTYDGVKTDFEMYSPLVREDGLIAFHDIVEHPHVPDTNVDAFWKELEQEYDTETIVSSPDCQEWGGIGVVDW